MAKKNDSKSTPAVPAKRAVKPVAAKTKTAPAKTASAKAKPAAAKAVKAKAPTAPAYTNDDIALRAYFIAEKRRAEGLNGDEHQDWIEAERQLASESKRPKKTAKA